MQTTLEAPCEPQNLPIANQVLVTIAVDDGKLVPLPYPARESDVVVFYRKEGHGLVKPIQVRWVAVGLGVGQEIRIEPKDGQPDVFDPIHPISFGKNSVCSGSPKISPSGQRLFWRYNIRLLQNGKQVDLVDPGVEIKTDP